MPNINRLCYTDILESSRSYWKILKLAVPVGLETIFQTLFGLIDQVIVGLLDAGAVAGIGLSNSVSFRRFANDFVMSAGFAARPSKAWLAISPKKTCKASQPLSTMEFDDASSPDPPVVLYGYDDDLGAFDDVTAEEQDASQDGRQIPSR